MNTLKTYCGSCSKELYTRKGLTDHKANERKQGRVKGHEAVAKSIYGSVIGTKNTHLKDVDMVGLPDNFFAKQREHIEEICGFIGDESLKTLTVKKDAPVFDKRPDPRAGIKSSNGGSTKTSDTIEQIK
jgi:hypothetical protein